ncbi:MAG TPA: hypothetical protein VHF89_19555 [Solirubrobacteraceae bacterium]|nr:hypothetical protein [Solirubrobacteraceae bacterium]
MGEPSVRVEGAMTRSPAAFTGATPVRRCDVRRVSMVVGLLVLGLGSWTGTAGAGHSQGDGPPGDFVQGTARLPESSGGGQFHFNARSGPAGEDPRGMYYAKQGIFGLFTFTSEVRCRRVEGNVAYIGTEVTRAQEGVQEGDPVVFRVEDNGEPGAGRDRFAGGPGTVPETDCDNPVHQAALTAASQTISQGNFVVHDGP